MSKFSLIYEKERPVPLVAWIPNYLPRGVARASTKIEDGELCSTN